MIELPVGLRDGLRHLGSFDTRALVHAIVHEHPVVGGYTGRLPRAVVDAYQSAPVLRSLLRLSAGQEADTSDQRLTVEDTGHALQQLGIGCIVLNRDTAPAALLR